MEIKQRKIDRSQQNEQSATTEHNSEDESKTRKRSLVQQLFLDQISANSYVVTRMVFIRLLGFVYTFSFLAAYNQNPMLIGYRGLYPAHIHMQHMKERVGVWQSPSLFYFLPAMDTSNVALKSVCVIGTLTSLFLLLTGRSNSILLLILWCLQTSLLNIGQLFYGYGWETQLLETTFLAMFLVPFIRLSKSDGSDPPSILFIFSMRFLISRIMLGAGLIKIRGDQCWRDLTCMHYHYETQPIPNPISYYLHQTPSTFHSFEVLVNHFIELFAPFLCMIPIRTVRHIGGMLQIMFQILLIVSGNLSFLNWITIAPALWCFDDSFLLYRLLSPKRPFMTKLLAKNHFRSVINILVFILLLYLSIDPILNLFSKYQRMNSSFDRFNLVNTYGAFGSVGKVRHEVIISGCNKTTINECEQNRGWLEYEFICKPGKINQRPCFSAPYHRRIAWQLWFAAMQNLQNNPWLIHLMIQLLASDQHSPINVFLSPGGNPFPEGPPRFVKADLYQYEFTRWNDNDSNWWKRHFQRPYSPVLDLKNSQIKSIFRQMQWNIPSIPIRS